MRNVAHANPKVNTMPNMEETQKQTPSVADLFSHEVSDCDFVRRNDKGDIESDFDVVKVTPEASADPEVDLSGHDFGMCRVKGDSLRYDSDHGDFVMEIVPQNPQFISVPVQVNYDDGTSGIEFRKRKQRSILVTASALVPVPEHSKRVIKKDQWARGLLRERGELPAQKREKTGGKRKRRVQRLDNSQVSGDLVAVKTEVFRPTVDPKNPEIIFPMNPDGFKARNAYMKHFGHARPNRDELSDVVPAEMIPADWSGENENTAEG